MTIILTAFHGTAPGEPLVGGQDPVSNQMLPCLWASNSYFLAAQFQDGEVRKLEISLKDPLVLTEEDRARDFNNAGHAAIVSEVMAQVEAGAASHDGVIFLDTVDGAELGDVAAVFPRRGPGGALGVDHCVTLIGIRSYDHGIAEWVSGPGFTDDVMSLPEVASWEITRDILTYGSGPSPS